jgi:hypothetical protein
MPMPPERGQRGTGSTRAAFLSKTRIRCYSQKVVMRNLQRLLLAAIVVACVPAAVAPMAARAYPAQHYFDKVFVENLTDKCAWITVYEASAFTPWSIVNSNAENRPQWLKPHTTHGFYFYQSAEVKVRAEVKQHADCTGATIIDTYDIRKNPTMANHTLHAGLFPNGNRYNLWFK